MFKISGHRFGRDYLFWFRPSIYGMAKNSLAFSSRRYQGPNGGQGSGGGGSGHLSAFVSRKLLAWSVSCFPGSPG